jgi:hypothetical protein
LLLGKQLAVVALRLNTVSCVVGFDAREELVDLRIFAVLLTLQLAGACQREREEKSIEADVNLLQLTFKNVPSLPLTINFNCLSIGSVLTIVVFTVQIRSPLPEEPSYSNTTVNESSARPPPSLNTLVKAVTFFGFPNNSNV